MTPNNESTKRSTTSNSPIAADGAAMRQEFFALLRLGMPLVVAQIAVVGLGAIDTALAGRIDRATLGGVAVGTAIWHVVLLLVLGALMASSALMAQARAAQQKERAALIFQHTLLLGLSIAAGGFFVLLGADLVMTLFDVDANVRPAAQDYLAGVRWGLPALAGYAALRYYCEGAGHTRASMVVALLSLALLFPIASALMFGWFGLPALKAYGCGLATAIVMSIEVVFLALYVRFGPLSVEQAWRRRPFSGPLLREISWLGLPVAFSILMEASLFYAVTLLMASLGELAVGAHQVALNVAAVTFMIPFGLAGALSIRVGSALGARDPAALRRTIRCGFWLTLITQLGSAALMVLLAPSIAGLYVPGDTVLIAQAASLLVLAAIFQLPDGAQVIANGALRGLQDTKVPALLTIVAYWIVGFPLSYWLGLRAGFGPEGLWMGFIGGLSCAAGLLIWRLRRSTELAASRLLLSTKH